MMKKQYKIEGMTCGGCVATVKKKLEELTEVTAANIRLTSPQGILELSKEVKVETLQKAIEHYSIAEIELPSAIK